MGARRRFIEVIIVLLLFTAPLVAFSLHVVNSYTEALESHIADTLLDTAQVQARVFQEAMARRLGVLVELAEQEEFARALSEGDSVALGAFLRELPGSDGRAMVLALKGKVAAPFVGMDVSGKDWFRQALRERRPMVAGIHEGLDGEWAFVLLAPVLQRGMVVGFLAEEHPLMPLLRELGLPQERFYLVDASLRGYSVSGLRDLSRHECARLLAEGATGVLSRCEAEGGSFAAFVPIEGTPFGVVVLQEHAAVLGLLGQFQDKVFMVGLPLLLLGWAVVLWAYSLYERNRALVERLRASEQALEQEVRERTRRLQGLYEVTAAMGRTLEAQEVLALMLKEAAEELGASHAAVYLYEDGQLRLMHSRGFSPEGEALLRRLKPGQGGSGRAVLSCREVLLPMEDYDPGPLKELLQGEGVGCVFSTPILKDGRALGALTLGLKGKRAPSDEEIGFMHSLAQQAAVALERSRLFQALQAAKRHWEETFDATNDIIYLHDPEGRILRANRQFLRLVGKEDFQEVLGKPYWELLGYRGSHEGCLKAIRNGQSRYQEVVNLQGRYFLMSFAPVFDAQGRHLYSVHVGMDITALKKAQERLKEEVEVSRALLKLTEVTSSILEQGQLIREMLALAPRYLRLDVLLVFLHEEPLKGFVYAGGYGMSPEEERGLQGYLFTDKDAPLFGALVEGQAVELGGTEALLQSRLGSLGLRALVALPIRHKDRLLGALLGGLGRPGAIRPREVSLLKGLANSMATALDNAALYQELEELFLGAVKSLTDAVDAKSPWTRGHSERVTAYAMAIGRELGLSETQMKTLRLAGLLHDVGKIGTYDAILDKPDRLTPEEFALVKQHPDKGARIIEDIKQLRDVAEVIRYHHERMDGKGYPYGVKGEAIPLLSRILAVADSFDSMTTDRPYRPAPGEEYAVKELRRCAGTQFDPRVVEAFLRWLQVETPKGSSAKV